MVLDDQHLDIFGKAHRQPLPGRKRPDGDSHSHDSQGGKPARRYQAREGKQPLPLSGTLSIQVGTGTTENFVIGSAPSTGAARNTVYTGDSVVTLSDLADAINTANIGVQATVTTPAGGVSTLTLTSATLGTDGTLNVTSGIAADGIGVRAQVVTTSTGSSLSLLSQTTGSSGALTNVRTSGR